MLYTEQIEQICAQKITQTTRLSGGMIGDVFRIVLRDGECIVAKISQNPDAALDIEGRMLRYLHQHTQLTIPQVIHSEKQLLLMTHIPNNGRMSNSGERETARQIAALHTLTNRQYGLEFDTLIGSLQQPNPLTDSWIKFFREHRILYMADLAHQEGRLPLDTRKNIDELAKRLEEFLHEPTQPSLIHGDLWGGNILARDGQLAGFIDPAIYFADPEIELAFGTLFGTFGPSFFEHYQQIHPIQQGFFEIRRDIYNIYPLLVHVRLFGGGYVHQVNTILKRFGAG